MITQKRLKELLHYDPVTGVFTWNVIRGRFAKPGEIAGNLQSSRGMKYHNIKILGKSYKTHRLAWLYVHGQFPIKNIDHINGDSLDNRITNLRDVSQGENNRNARLNKRNKTGQSGVYWLEAKQKYRAIINDRGKQIHLGYFSNFNEAVTTRKQAEQTLDFHSNHRRS